MKNLMKVLALAGAGGVAAADFPADTLLPVTWVQSFVEPGFDSDSASFTYARDARDWLHETRVVTEKSGYLNTTVTITDREGRYRGGSYQERSKPAFTFTGHHDSAGRLFRVVYDSPVEGVFHEDYTYDAQGGLVSRILADASGRVAKQRVWANTYDAAGRLRMSVESDPRTGTWSWDVKHFFDSTGRLLYQHRESGSFNSVEHWDSIAYLYRTDGRLQEQRKYQDDGSLQYVIRWEYQVWQVPLVLRRRAAGSGAGYLGGRPWSWDFDVLGRKAASHRAHVRGSIPLFPRP